MIKRLSEKGMNRLGKIQTKYRYIDLWILLNLKMMMFIIFAVILSKLMNWV